MKLHVLTVVVGAAALVGTTAQADQIVQMGSLAGGTGQQMQDIVLDQFDTAGGTLQLNFIQLDVLTSIIGGGTANGTGQPTDIFASLSVDYFLGADLLAETHALIDTQISNGSSASFTVFNTDTAQSVINNPALFAPWTGNGSVILTALSEFILSETPAGSVDFSAGGTVQYTLTYDFSPIPAPASCMTIGLGVIVCGRRRR